MNRSHQCRAALVLLLVAQLLVVRPSGAQDDAGTASPPEIDAPSADLPDDSPSSEDSDVGTDVTEPHEPDDSVPGGIDDEAPVVDDDGDLADDIDAGVGDAALDENAQPDPGAAEADEEPTASVLGNITVTPSTDLVDGQIVTIRGTGWSPNALLGAAQCREGATIDGCELSDIPLFSADSRGRFSQAFRVEAIVDSTSGTADCRAIACVIAVNNNYTVAGAAIVPIAFDPAGPLAPPPTLTATPNSGLVDGQSVALSGSGFTPNGYVSATLCRLPAASYEDCSSYGGSSIQTDAAGDASGTVIVDAVFPTYSETGFDLIDCRIAACGLVTGEPGVPGELIVVPLGFDPGAPLRPPPSLTADPSTDLRDADVVDLQGAGYRPYDFAETFQCRADANDYGGCVFNGASYVDGDGNLTGQLIVQTLIPQFGGPAYDCRIEPCVAVAISGGFYGDLSRAGVAPLSFDPDAPAGLSPTMKVEPARDLVDGQQVTVSGVGFRPSSTIGLIQCVVDAGSQAGCDTSTLSYGYATSPVLQIPDDVFGVGGVETTQRATSPAYGSMQTSFTVRRVLHLDDGRTVDCAVVACMLGAGDIQQLDMPTSVPLSFTEGAAVSVLPAGIGPVAGSPSFTG